MLIVLMNNILLMAEIEEVYAEIGDPNCKLNNPFVVENSGTLKPWISEFTNDKFFMINSDKILTIVEPKEEILKKYLEIIE